MICKSCGTAASDEVRLCPGCGVPFVIDADAAKLSRDKGKAKPQRWTVFFICLTVYIALLFFVFMAIGFIA